MLKNRLVHLHIPKTAGSALRTALQRAAGSSLRVFANTHEKNFANVDREAYDVFSGHFGFETATQIGGDLITLLRNPVDRFVSVYYFWRQLHAEGVEVTPKTICAARYSLDEFVRIYDEPLLTEEFFNRATWQIAFGSSLDHRRRYRAEGNTEQHLFSMARENLEQFAMIGVQENVAQFSDDFADRYGIRLVVPRHNVTKQRSMIADVSTDTLKKIHDWVYLDIELYAHLATIRTRTGRRDRQRERAKE